jgi:iron-sulfur cluster assembly accessory protein
MLTITENAANKIKVLSKDREQVPQGIRVGVRGGGCSGFSYFLEFAESSKEGDRILETNGVKIFVDDKSYLYLMGVEVDYVDGLVGAGFKFQNPNARRTCGCGESFSI